MFGASYELASVMEFGFYGFMLRSIELVITSGELELGSCNTSSSLVI